MSAKLGSTHKTPWSVGKRTLLAKTCLTCGKLQQGSEYRRHPKGYWYSSCIRCMSLNSRKLDKRSNAESQDTARKRYEPWTGSSLQELEDLNNQGLSYKEIAVKLGRSIGSIHAALYRYGISKRLDIS